MRCIKLNVFLDHDHKSSRIISCNLRVKRNMLLAFKVHTCRVGVIFITASIWERWFQERGIRKPAERSHPPQQHLFSFIFISECSEVYTFAVVLALLFSVMLRTWMSLGQSSEGAKMRRPKYQWFKRKQFLIQLIYFYFFH